MIKLIQDLILKSAQKPKTLIDSLKTQFKSITLFFEYISHPLINLIRPFRDIEVPRSNKYNQFLSNIESDINLIHAIQKEIKNNILSSWNVDEVIIQKPENEYKYDNKFLLENPKATITTDRITLNIKSTDSVVSKIKDKPILVAECSDKRIPIYYGKAWGSYKKGDESGEDGIRAENNDGKLIVDEKDTFWEAEAVVVQAKREDTKFLQPIYDKDISLSVSVKIIFNEPTNLNTIVIRPYNAAVNAYYKLVKVEVSDGVKNYPINIKETFIYQETMFILDIPEIIENGKIKGLFLTFKQDSGYYMKYTLGYFKIKSVGSWVDVTGPWVTEKAKKMGGNFNENVSYLIENSNKWILNYWIPGATFTEEPKLDVTKGENGFITVPSSESKRKRYTIGITDIKIGNNIYDDISEIVTNPIKIPDKCNTISLLAEDKGNVTYLLSFDNGMKWHKIVPIGRLDIRGNDLRIVPKKLYINSDLSLWRKRNTDTGEAAFIYTSNDSVRLKIILKKETDKIIPSVFSWQLVWGQE